MYYTICVLFVLMLILTLLTCITYVHLTRNFKHWKDRNVPYITPVPLFGNFYKVFTFKLSIGEYLGELYNMTKQPFIGFFVFDKPFLLIRDPEIIKRCLIKDFDHFEDRNIIENKRDDEMGSLILFVLKNPAWKQVRAKCDTAFAAGRIKGMLPLMLESSDDLVDYLINNIALNSDGTNSREVAVKYTTDTISSCAFGINAHCFRNKNAKLREVSRRFFDWGFIRKVSMTSYVFAPTLVTLFRLKFLEPNARNFIQEVFNTTLAEREKSKAYRDDLINTLIQIRGQNKPGSYQFEGKMLAAQAIQFFVAGFETTGSTISFALYELSLNPSIQSRLREEIRTVLKKYSDITYEAIQEMEYLDMAMKETLRKYPPLPYLDRQCNKPYEIPGTDVVIEKGVSIYIPLFGLHYDSQYFPNPEKYDPERFRIENMATRPSFCYMPFGKGPHNCIGAKFGVLAAKIALIKILNEFEVEVCNTTPIPMKFDQKSFLLAPEKPLNLHFKRNEWN